MYIKNKWITSEKVGPLKEKEGNLCLESAGVDKVLNAYFASAFTKENDMEESEINVRYTNMLGQFAFE